MPIPSQPNASPEFPQAFGKYTLLRKLARGGMAELFLARKQDSPRLYVIKRVLPGLARDRSFLSMFLTEAKTAAQLDHPNIIQIDALGREGPHIYLAMEYVDGIDLERLLKACGGIIPPDIMAQIAMDLCDALCFANRSKDITTGAPLNVIHRDVTPGNVMISRQGVVKLVDFGVTKATTQSEHTKAGIVKGKFRYMSPEQVQLQELDGRSDLFSVGVLLYEATTGTRPFDRKSPIEIVQSLINWDPTPPDKLIKGYPKAISDVIMRALKKDREQRYADGYEMKRALEKALSTLGSIQDPTSFITQYLPPPLDIPPFVLPGGKVPSRRTSRPEKAEMASRVEVPQPSDGVRAAKKIRQAEQPPAKSPDRGRKASSAPKDEFGDWDAPEADINAPDPDDPRRNAPPAGTGMEAHRNPSSQRAASSVSGRVQDSRSRGYFAEDGQNGRKSSSGSGAHGVHGARAGGESSATRRASSSDSAKKASSHGLSSQSSSKRRNTVGAWSRKDPVLVQTESLKDHDDSWKVSNKALRNFTRAKGDTGAVLDDDASKSPSSEKSSHLIRNIAIVAFIAAAALIFFAAGGTKLFTGGSADGTAGAAGGTSQIIVKSVLGNSGTVLIDGVSCDIPCTKTVSSGQPHQVVNSEVPDHKVEITLNPNETVNLTLEGL